MTITSITRTVKEMRFSDLYLGHPELGHRLADVPGAPANPVLAGPELEEDISRLIAECKSAQSATATGNDFTTIYDGVQYRVSVMPSVGGDVFVLRRMSAAITSLQDLGVHEAYRERMLAKELCGLFVISGAMNSGKTTTACAMVRERLLKFGGVAVTAEDPVEMPLEGLHGTGVCFQTAARRDRGGFAEAARNIVRWGADIIMIGEIRDDAVAAEALRAGMNGHLVISTIHADNAINAIRRLQALASKAFESGTAQALLADGLAGVMHQRLVGDPRRLETELLNVKGVDSVVANVRSGALDRLQSDLKLQLANIVNAPAYRRAG